MDLEKILVCWDGSEQSRMALRYAIDQAKKEGIDKIAVIYAIEGMPSGFDLDFEDGENLFDYEFFDVVKSQGEKLLEEAKSIVEDEGLEVETHMTEYGFNPSSEIVKFAEENNFDHIIVGSHGRSGISRILLGSIAEGIIRKAHCIVTVVRGKCD